MLNWWQNQMWQRQTRRSSLSESVKALEADIHHANSLVAAIPRDIAGDDSVQMKLCLSPLAPFLLFLLEWMGCSCLDAFLSCLGLLNILVYKYLLELKGFQWNLQEFSGVFLIIIKRVYADGMPIACPEERIATLEEFYAVIYPMLKQLEGNLVNYDLEKNEIPCPCTAEDECGICMEMDCNLVVLPICGHSTCITCFNEWYVRSLSCPFCRGSLKRVTSGDLWVLTSDSDVVDVTIIAKDNLRRFYIYIDKLPHLESYDSLLIYNYLI
ncbi:hypothetical protein OROMI_023203 [Orobanche minor]